eukprot:364692-Chlamydomonas_euryale.AAC.9
MQRVARSGGCARKTCYVIDSICASVACRVAIKCMPPEGAAGARPTATWRSARAADRGAVTAAAATRPAAM